MESSIKINQKKSIKKNNSIRNQAASKSSSKKSTTKPTIKKEVKKTTTTTKPVVKKSTTKPKSKNESTKGNVKSITKPSQKKTSKIKTKNIQGITKNAKQVNSINETMKVNSSSSNKKSKINKQPEQRLERSIHGKKIKSMEEEIIESQIYKNHISQKDNINEIEVTGPILTGQFIADSDLFSGDIERIPNAEEEEAKKRSKFNTNYEERQAALKAYKEAKEAATTAALEMEENVDHSKSSFSTIDGSKTINNIKQQRLSKSQNLNIAHPYISEMSNIINNEFEKMGKSPPQSLSDLEMMPITKTPLENKLRMNVKNVDEIIDDLNRKKSIDLNTNVTPFSDVVSGKKITSTIKNNLISQLALATNNDHELNEPSKSKYKKRNNNNNNNNNNFHQKHQQLQNNPTSDINIDNDVKREKSTFNANDNFLNKSGFSIEEDHSSGEMATLEEILSQKVGGIGKPTLGGHGNYRNIPKGNFEGNNFRSRDKEVDFDYSNKKPQYAEIVKKQSSSKQKIPIILGLKGSNLNRIFRKKGEMSAMEQYKSERTSPGGYRNTQSMNDDGMNINSSEDDMLGGISSLGNITINRSSNLVKKFQTPKRIPKQFKKSLSNSNNDDITNKKGNINKKSLQQEMIENFQKLEIMDIDGMSRQNNYGGLYSGSLSKLEVKLMNQRRGESFKRNKRAKNSMKNKSKNGDVLGKVFKK